ncbi:MAG: DMT family transporter [Actinomycetes bacterium]
MLAVAFALTASLAFGFTDFLGGLASRSAHVLVVGTIVQPVGLLLMVPLLAVFPGVLSAPALWWGLMAGLGGAVAFLMLFRSLAIGPMSVASPLSALTSAIVLVLAGLTFGERLDGLSIVGIVMGLAAVLLITRQHEDNPHPVTRGVVVLSLTAGLFVAVFFLGLERAPDDSGLWPLVTSRAVASLVMVLAAVGSGVAARPGPTVLKLSLGSATFDVVATASFLFATREGLLAVVAVITALYPAGTILMARLVLGERIQLIQRLGLVVAACSVTLLALAG